MMIKSILDFLKQVPDKWFLLLVWLIVFSAWYVTKHDFLAQLVRDLTMAILTLLGVRKAITPEEIAATKPDDPPAVPAPLPPADVQTMQE